MFRSFRVFEDDDDDDEYVSTHTLSSPLMHLKSHSFSLFCVRFNTIKKRAEFIPFAFTLPRATLRRKKELNEQGEKSGRRSRNVFFPRVELGAVRAVQLRDRRRRDDRRHRCGCAHSVFRVGKPERKGGIDEETKEEKRVNHHHHHHRTTTTT